MSVSSKEIGQSNQTKQNSNKKAFQYNAYQPHLKYKGFDNFLWSTNLSQKSFS